MICFRKVYEIIIHWKNNYSREIKIQLNTQNKTSEKTSNIEIFLIN